MKVAVTGGSGVVGRALLKHLVDAGDQVRALARTGEAAGNVGAIGAEAVRGDVLDPQSLATLISGAERVFHVAGVNEMCPKDPWHMDRVNIVGTSNIRDACVAGGVRRLIHTSSAVAIGERHGVVGSETSPHRGRYLSRYERSKHISEVLVLEGGSAALEVVSVNPASVQGPGRTTGTAKLILDLIRGKLPFLLDTIVSIVDIDDCARGHLLAADLGRAGDRYLLSGTSLSVVDAVTMVTRVSGISVRPRFLPGPVAAIAGGGVELGARIAGREPLVCREMVRVARHGHRYDGSKATRDLGLSYTPFEETIARTVDWFRAQGLLEA